MCIRDSGTGDFVGALGETLEAESLTRVLYPDDSTTAGQGLRFLQEYFLEMCIRDRRRFDHWFLGHRTAAFVRSG